MTPAIDDLLCPACRSYAHPFLDACAVCGAARESRFAEALAAPDLGYARLLRSQPLADQVREVVLRYSLKRSDAPPEVLVRDGLVEVGDALAYRVRAAGPRSASSERAHFELDGDTLVLRERNPSAEIVRVPLDAILVVSHAASSGRRARAWAGLAFDRRVDPAAPPEIDGDLVITYAASTGLGRLALANRRGIFAARARADHYRILAGWLGVLAGAAAEARWKVVGPRRHAAELGLAAMPDETAGWPAAPAVGHGAAGQAAGGQAGRETEDARGGGAVPAGTSVRDALEALEELHAARLVTDEEYAVKRREILARL